MPPEMGMPPAMAPAAPSAAGIEALMAPPAAPPMDQAPMQMAEGGYVQRFQEGSDERGVTPDDSFSSQSITPEILRRAQEGMMAQRGAGNLKQAVADVMPTYREILGGGDRRTMQGQALMDIAQAGLRLASGRNAQGANIAGGSFASQLASAAEGLPGKLSERAGQFQQEERAIKLAALKSAESNVDTQRKLYAQIVKSSGQSPFGKGLMGGALSVLNSPLLEKYANGQTNPQETNLVETAKLIAERATTESYTDDKNKRQERVTPGIQLPHVAAAFQQSQSVLGGGRTTTPADTTTTTTTGSAADVPLADRPAVIDPKDPFIRDNIQDEKRAQGDTPAAAPVDFTNLTPQQHAQLRTAGQQWDKTQAGKGISATTELPTLWANIDPAIGLPNQLKNTLGRVVPLNIAGQYSRTVAQSTRNIKNVVGEMVETFQKDEKMSDADRTFALRTLIDLEVDFFQNPANFKDRVLTLGLGLEGRRLAALEIAKNPLTDNKERNKQENAAAILATQIKKLGLPPFINTQAEFDKLKIGDEYLVKDKETDTWVPGQKKPPGFRDQKKR
jgi:hypothetical protein